MGNLGFALSALGLATAALVACCVGGVALAKAGERIRSARRDSTYRAAALQRRLDEAARRRAEDRVVQLGEECVDHLISANLAMQLRQVNMAAACRRAAQRCANEALAIAHEVGA